MSTQGDEDPLIRKAEDRGSKKGKIAILLIVCLNSIAFYSLLPAILRVSELHYSMPARDSTWEVFVYLGMAFTIPPIVGAFLADVVLGKVWTINIGTSFQTIGIAIMLAIHLNRNIKGENDFQEWMITWGIVALFFNAFGIGFVMCSIIPLLKLQYLEESESTKIVGWYIWTISIARCVSSYVAPEIIINVGPFGINNQSFMYLAVMQIACLIISIIVSATAAFKRWIIQSEPEGKANLKGLLRIKDEVGEIKECDRKGFFKFVGIILPMVMLYELVYSQIFTTFQDSAQDILACFNEAICYNNATYNNSCPCYVVNKTELNIEIESNFVTGSGALLIFIIMPILLLTPLYDIIFTSDISVHSFRRGLRFTLIMAALSMLIAVIAFATIITKMNNSEMKPKWAWSLMPCVLSLGLAQIAGMNAAYNYAFYEARRILPGLECTFISCLTLCLGVSSFLACGVYYIITKIYTSNQSLGDVDELYCRTYFFAFIFIIISIYATYLMFATRNAEGNRQSKYENINDVQKVIHDMSTEV